MRHEATLRQREPVDLVIAVQREHEGRLFFGFFFFFFLLFFFLLVFFLRLDELAAARKRAGVADLLADRRLAETERPRRLAAALDRDRD